MDVKRKHKLCTEIYKSLSNLNPSFMKGIFELRLFQACKRASSLQNKKLGKFRSENLE